MCIRSRDKNMTVIFNNGMDFHSVTGSFILGMEYDDLVRDYQAGDKVATENRQYGKLVNLAGNYRIGASALSRKGFEEYDLIIPVQNTYYFLGVFKTRYSGIPDYWDESIALAKAKGFAETFAGRRYKIDTWTSDRAWQSESSALMHPIQGGGAEMKCIAVKEIYEEVPEAQFALDLHDASFVWVPEDGAAKTKAKLDEVLNNIDYSKYWGFVPPIKLPYESHIGESFADLK